MKSSPSPESTKVFEEFFEKKQESSPPELMPIQHKTYNSFKTITDLQHILRTGGSMFHKKSSVASNGSDGTDNMLEKNTIRKFSYKLDSEDGEESDGWKRVCCLTLMFIVLLIGTVAATICIVIFGLKSFSDYKPEET
ncbi:unnamed protein product [Bursaphelenchus okinawaensis]|uniref:Uncharacterized protein n=1 Tax=Bursaphelenchus okinawaensis TaxID=465554 RepID=A0A811LPM1_9BILA|nr:unnamed protein product [Bursaphelenchus okinawaensis]CAG9125060.1 unnamed protein product [Bursaphelenchus okinawaensis]